MKVHPQIYIHQQLNKIEQLNTTQAENEKDPKLLKAVKDFEAVLVYQMLKSMRETISKSGLTEDAPGKDFFTGMFDNEVAKTISQKQNSTLADALYKQLSGQAIIPTPQKTKSIVMAVNHSRTDVYNENNLLSRINRFQPIIDEAAQRFNLDANLIKAVIAQESSGNPKEISSKGATGLMQLMKETAKEMGVKNIHDPKENIMGGTKYLHLMLKRFDGDLNLALAAYNAGPGAVEKYKRIPPYNETQNYVKKVLNYYKSFSGEVNIAANIEKIH